MDFNLGEILATVVPQIGFGSIFLWLFLREEKSNREDLKEKDKRIDELTRELVGLTAKNIEVMTQFKEAVNSNTNAMQTNNNSIQTLSEKISTLIASGLPQR